MPELGKGLPEDVKNEWGKILADKKQGKRGGSIEDLIYDSPLEVIGYGGQSIVVNDIRNTDKVIAVDNDLNVGSEIFNPEQAKTQYYWHQIMHVLFPHNFPRMHMSSGGNKGEEKIFSGTVREKINETNRSVEFPFSNVEDFCYEIGMHPHDLFDVASVNFEVGEDGGEYYLDRMNKNFQYNVIVREKILDYMSVHDYDTQSIARVASMLDRIGQISKSN